MTGEFQLPKIKICGLFREADIQAVNLAMPDFIGFIFYRKSHRYIDFDTAQKLKADLNPKIKAVGVFVNEPLENIVKLCKNRTIDIVQLHGNEDEIFIHKLKAKTGVTVIKARHDDCKTSPAEPSADFYLFDNDDPVFIGGSGKTFDWNLIPKVDKPFFLAGGLNAGNIKEAIKKVKPYAVDISSGVETNGLKDKGKILEIVKIVRGQEND